MFPILIHHEHLILIHVVIQVVVLSATHAAHKLDLLKVAALSFWQRVHHILMFLCCLPMFIDDVFGTHRTRHGR